MTFLFNSLFLVTWLTSQVCPEIHYEGEHYDYLDVHDSEKDPLPPNITVYQQVEDRELFMVMCTIEMWSHSWWSSSELSVETQSNNYTLENIFTFQRDVKYFKVTASPPVSFTCVQNNDFGGNITTLHSETYIFNQSGYPTIQVNKISVSDHVNDGVSSFYIGFVCFIAVGLFIMTAAVIVTTIKSKTKERTIGATNNDYEDA